MPLAALLLLTLCGTASAQVDPDRRRLLQLGYDQPLSGPGPVGGYGFFYANEPKFVKDHLTLRVALAPTYVDSELGIREVAPRTDAGIGLAGGGFAESYNEVRRGHYHKEESFNGHGLSMTGSLYPKVSPESWRVPVSLIVRGGVHSKYFARRGQTSPAFALPPDHVDYRFRAGVRVGGSPPEVRPPRAAELSVWYQGYLRDRHANYGYLGDRELERTTHLYWTRAMFAWRQKSGRHFKLAAEAGASSTPDRLNAYRLGGLLPFASEFPLSLPGYYNGEISARRYALFGGDYLIPLGQDGNQRWACHVFANAANVAYLRGMEQPDHWNQGVGTGLNFDSADGVVSVEFNYAYGVNALRARGRGAHSFSIVAQLDLMAWRRSADPKRHKEKRMPAKPEALDWMFRLFRP
jgi:hypothetical protein